MSVWIYIALYSMFSDMWYTVYIQKSQIICYTSFLDSLSLCQIHTCSPTGQTDIIGDEKSGSIWPFQTGSPHLSRFTQKGQTHTHVPNPQCSRRSVWMDNKSERSDAMRPLRSPSSISWSSVRMRMMLGRMLRRSRWNRGFSLWLDRKTEAWASASTPSSTKSRATSPPVAMATTSDPNPRPCRAFAHADLTSWHLWRERRQKFSLKKSFKLQLLA